MPVIKTTNLKSLELTESALPTEQEQLFPEEVSEPRLHIFTPEQGKGSERAVMMLPGGGYNKVALAQCFDVATWLGTLGLTSGVLEYRLPRGRRETVFEDMEAAWNYLRQNASKLGIAPEKMGVAGFSVGGLMAGLWSTLYAGKAEFRPAFSLLYYPVVNLLDPAQYALAQRFLGGAPQQEDLQQYSPHLQVIKNTPPAMLLLSDDDTSVLPEHSLLYYAALKENSIAASMHIFTTGGHAWSSGPALTFDKPFAHAATARELTADWLAGLS